MKILPLLIISLFTTTALAWNGYDYGNGSFIEIGAGSLVKPGQEIEVYDYGKGEYIKYRVNSVRGNNSGAKIVIYDYGSGEYRTLDMD